MEQVTRVVLSDLSGQQVAEEARVKLIIKQHPDLDAPVYLDAGADEVEGLAAVAGDFVVLQTVAGGVAGNDIIVSLEAFEGLFSNVDPVDVLESAHKLEAPTNGGGKAKRDPAYLADVRTWARAQGFELSDKGRIKAEIEEAYTQAQAA